MQAGVLKGLKAERTVDILTKTLDGRVDAYEIFLSFRSGRATEVKDAEIDSFKVSYDFGVGIRTLFEGRMGFGYSSLLSRSALDGMVQKTIEGSLVQTSDPFLSFPTLQDHKRTTKAEPFDLSSIIDPSIEDGSGESAVETARLVETSAREADSRIARIRKSSYSESSLDTRLINSRGIDSCYSATFFSASISVVAQEGSESQMGWEVSMGHKRSDVDPVWVGRTAAKRAVALIGARKIGSRRCPVILENTVAMELLGAFSGAFFGDNVAKGKSMLASLEGKQVLSKSVSVHDNGVLSGGWATSLLDGEGVRQSDTQLIDRGKLKGFLYDTYWAKRAGKKSTGNADRSNYKGVSSIGTTNFYIDGGKRPMSELLESMDSGLLITELMGVHTINTINGEFSLGAQGYLVEGGELKYPVRGVAISGDLLGLFSKVEEVGSDLRFMGGTGAPSLLLNELDISGG